MKTITRWEVRYDYLLSNFEDFEKEEWEPHIINRNTREEARRDIRHMKGYNLIYRNIKLFRVKETVFKDGTPLIATYTKVR